MYPILAAALAVPLALFSADALARSAEAAEQLGTTLTPMGGQMEGNAAGSIPPWQGGLTMAPAGYERSGQHHIDPFASDEPLFTIDSSNLEQHRGQLTPGQQALFANYPGTFRMPVFVSRRTGSAPEAVYEHTRVNAQSAQLREGGNGFIGAYGGVPFPLPRNGVEAVWNHITRYRGTYLTRRSAEVAVQRNGGYVPIVTEQQALFRFYDPRVSAAELDNRLFYYLTQTRSPARLAGGAILVHETLDQLHEPRQAWAYNSGQRRVRRAPSLAYDTPIAAADGLRTADDTDMYNGSPDRYEWKLLGKQEIYIPYNNYRLGSPQISYKQLLTPSHLNPEYTRYELHRVWVVEGTLKKDARHVYSKRRLYLDEDSWQAAVVDQYDGRGDLWRVSMAYLKNYYELPTVWSALDVYHDLQARRYHVQNLDNEEVATVDFSQPLPDAGDFTPAALRRQGTR